MKMLCKIYLFFCPEPCSGGLLGRSGVRSAPPPLPRQIPGYAYVHAYHTGGKTPLKHAELQPDIVNYTRNMTSPMLCSNF